MDRDLTQDEFSTMLISCYHAGKGWAMPHVRVYMISLFGPLAVMIKTDDDLFAYVEKQIEIRRAESEKPTKWGITGAELNALMFECRDHSYMDGENHFDLGKVKKLLTERGYTQLGSLSRIKLAKAIQGIFGSRIIIHAD